MVPPHVTRPDFALVVSLHDVAPATLGETGAWLSELDALGVPATLLVIPAAFGGGPSIGAAPDAVAELKAVRARGHELSLHGLTHAGVPGGPAWRRRVNAVMARGAGEFCALPEEEARRRLIEGRAILADAGIEVTGFTPPGWLASPGTRTALAGLGFGYWTSQAAVHDLRGGRTHLMPALSHRPGGAGERAGARLMVGASRLLSRTRRPFRIALHPADLSRPGLREAALAAITHAVGAGARPVTYASLVASE
jgi:predicted deacetylase